MEIIQNIFHVNILTVIILIPITGSLCIALIDEKLYRNNVKYAAIWSSLFVLILSTWLCIDIDKTQYFYISFADLTFYINATSAYMAELTAITIFLSIFFAEKNISSYYKYNSFSYSRFYISILLLEALLVILFFNTNILMFFFLFEFIIILISIMMGHFFTMENNIKTFFLSMSTASFLIFFCAIYLLNISGTTDIQILKQYSFTKNQEILISILLYIAFSIIGGIFPFHFWVYKICATIPSVVKIFIFGIFLKISIWGIISIILPISKNIAFNYGNYINILAIVSIVFSTIKTLKNNKFQITLEHISSVYISIIIIGVFSCNFYGINGAIWGMITHSIIFLGVYSSMCILGKNFEERISLMQEIPLSLPILAIIIFLLSGIFFPLLPGFSFLITVLISISKFGKVVVVLLTLLSITSINFFRTIHQLLQNIKPSGPKLNFTLYETTPVVILMLIVIYMGFFPNNILTSLFYSVKNLVHQKIVYERPTQ